MKSIVILIAMQAEAQPLLSALGAMPVATASKIPVEAFQAIAHGSLVTVVVNGVHPRHGVDMIGTDAASLAAAFAIDNFRPELVLTAGTAGGRRSNGTRIGDVILARERFVYHDRRIPLSGFQELGIGSFPASGLGGLAESLGFTTGVISTGNSFGETTEDLKMLDASGALAIDMESAAVASVCELHEVPCAGVRIIANMIDDSEQSVAGFEQELEAAAAHLCAALLAVLAALATTTTISGSNHGNPA